jgi:NADH-ubiquinone oxidoreductase chain 2
VSSLLSLIIGTVVGLAQFRIKRLFAYSTISHVGFILLALSINSIESIQAFIFYLMQYSISNLNAFIILISIGYSLYCYVNNSNEFKQLLDKNNSPIQLISQLKGYFYVNPVLSLSLTITIFSFVGIPPLIGFFAKQMVLSAALDSGYVFLALIAILTSVISAVYYLNIIKQIFYDKSEYTLNPDLLNIDLHGNIVRSSGLLRRIKAPKINVLLEKLRFSTNNIVLSSSLTITISILTLIILLFIFIPQE